MSDAPSRSRLLDSLARASGEHPFARKLLVCSRPAEGRELLRALSASGTPWAGWEVTSLRQLAHELAALDLAEAGLQLADEFEVQARVDEALDAVEDGGRAGPLGRAGGALGLRDAIRSAVSTLRGAGIGPGLLARARPGDAKLAALAEILREYETRLSAAGKADPPEVLRRAVARVEAGESVLSGGRVYLVPGLPLRGLAGRLVQLLRTRAGTEVLSTDAVLGLEWPGSVLWNAPGHATGPLSLLHAPGLAGHEGRVEAGLFAGATPADELREVLRCVVESGVPGDQVEIVATDPATYGAALDSLSRRLGIPVTYASGLDIRRTRVGRALGTYLRWVAENFPADLLRGLLETDDLNVPAEDTSGAALARRLRRLRVGWGQDRYLPAIREALDALREPAADDGARDPEEAAAARERARRELEALEAVLRPILEATPQVGPRTRAEPSRTSPAALAGGALAFLECVRAEGEVEQTLRSVYRQRLGRIQATLTRETVREAALATLRGRLETRVAGADEDGATPWTSAGGHLHLSDVATGGTTGRPHVFVVGLDASRTGSGGAPDPLLTESDRRLLNALAEQTVPPLPGTAARSAERRHAVAAMLARLRGKVTLSYSAWDAAEGRAVSPAPELLQALRLREGDVTLTYEQLYEALGPLACAVPRDGRAVDGTDVWMGALFRDDALREGTGAVRAAFSGLDRGLHAQDQRRAHEVTAHDGRVTVRAGLDPRDPDGPVLSASRLETIGACPRRYFYRYVLGVQPPEDPEWDPERWLTPAERGTLLHAVYERALREARARGVETGAGAFAALALDVLAGEARRAEQRAPAPSATVRELEMEHLRYDVLSFAAMLRDDPPEWRELELRFGPGARPVAVRLAGGGELRVRGAIDRVDATADGRLRVVDYKTGRTGGYLEGKPYDGGRRIQHVLYTAAAEQLQGAEVEAMEYHFPTRRGENHRVRYTADALASGAEVLDALCELAAGGGFVSTESHDDCRYCGFQPVCHVETNDYGGVTSEIVSWARSRCKDEDGAPPEYAPLLTLRGLDG